MVVVHGCQIGHNCVQMSQIWTFFCWLDPTFRAWTQLFVPGPNFSCLDPWAQLGPFLRKAGIDPIGVLRVKNSLATSPGTPPSPSHKQLTPNLLFKQPLPPGQNT